MSLFVVYNTTKRFYRTSMEERMKRIEAAPGLQDAAQDQALPEHTASEQALFDLRAESLQGLPVLGLDLAIPEPDWVRHAKEKPVSDNVDALHKQAQDAYLEAAVANYTGSRMKAQMLSHAHKASAPYIRVYYDEMLPALALQSYVKIRENDAALRQETQILLLQRMVASESQRVQIDQRMENIQKERGSMQDLLSNAGSVVEFQKRLEALPEEQKKDLVVKSRYTDPQAAYGYTPGKGWASEKGQMDFSPAVRDHLIRVGRKRFSTLKPTISVQGAKETLKQFATRLTTNLMEQAMKDKYILAYLREGPRVEVSQMVLNSFFSIPVRTALLAEIKKKPSQLTALQKDVEEAIMDALSTRKAFAKVVSREEVRIAIDQKIKADGELQTLAKKDVKKVTDTGTQKQEQTLEVMQTRIEQERIGADFVAHNVPEGTKAHVLNERYVVTGPWLRDAETMTQPTLVVFKIGELDFMRSLLQNTSYGSGHSLWDEWQVQAMNRIDALFPTTDTQKNMRARLIRRDDDSFDILVDMPLDLVHRKKLEQLRVSLQTWLQDRTRELVGQDSMRLFSHQRRLKDAMHLAAGKAMPEVIHPESLPFLANDRILERCGLTVVDVTRLSPQEAWVLSEALGILIRRGETGVTDGIGAVMVGADTLFTSDRPKSPASFKETSDHINAGIYLSSMQGDLMFVPQDKQAQQSQANLAAVDQASLASQGAFVETISQRLGLMRR